MLLSLFKAFTILIHYVGYDEISCNWYRIGINYLSRVTRGKMHFENDWDCHWGFVAPLDESPYLNKYLHFWHQDRG